MLKFIQRSLFNKLLILLLVISLVPIGIVGYMNFNTAKKTLEHDQFIHLEFVADVKVKIIETFYKNLEDEIRITQDYFNIKTNLPIVTQFAQDRTSPEYITAKENLDSQLKSWLHVKSGTVIDLMLVNPEGIIVYVVNKEHVAEDLYNPLPDPGNKAFEEGKKGVYFTDIFRNQREDFNFGILVTAPVNDDDGNFIGVIAFEIDMTSVYELIQDTKGLGETGETLIGKKIIPYEGSNEEHVIFLNPLRHDPNAAFKRVVVIGSDNAIPMQEAILGKRGTGYSVDYRGEEIIAHWRHIPSRSWGLVAKIDSKEALAPVNGLKLKTLFITISTGILVVFIAYFVAMTITKPITKFSEQSVKITEGDMTGSVLYENRSDEIGLLASNFNVMVQELKKRVDELEDFHRITVGRELKMIELEKEIERLKEDLIKEREND